jgi:hypothetical protein
MKMSEDLILQTFFYCESNSPNGVYAENVDVMELSRKIEAIARNEAIKECINLLKDGEFQDAAKALKPLLEEI